LILLLVKSDFLKSAVFVVFPIVSFAWGSIPSDSAFCQISGFALTVGIESSDIAVLLIALHSAMYIFRPRLGLYPYRQFAYLVFHLYPVLAASLAFIQGNGYENMGHFCYLRTDRSWERLALSWVPRYIIFAGIVVIYAFIYLYIRRRMGDYGRRRSEAMQPRPLRGSSSSQRIPRLCYNGLIPSTSCSRRTSEVDTISAAKDRLRPSSSIGPAGPGSARTSTEVPPSRSPVRWNWTGFTQAESYRLSSLSSDDTRDPIAPNSPNMLSPPPAHTHRRVSLTAVDNPSQSPQTHPLPDIPDSSPILPPPAASLSTAPTTTDPDPNYDHEPTHQPNTTNRKPTLRQLRSLFVYPLVYTIIWLFPFISHILGYDDNSSQSSSPPSPEVQHHEQNPPPHWLLIVSIISLCVQGAVDCAVFLARETPWRFGARDRPFWGALGRRVGWWFGMPKRWLWGEGGRRTKEGVGRSREEMLVDGRLARERREGEVLVELERGRLRRVGRMGSEGRREWWDVYGDGDGDGVEVDDDDDVYVDGVEDEEGQTPVRQEVG
jgi:G protein-coupled receptor GPR1